MTQSLTNIRELALDVLQRVEEEKSYSNLLLNMILNKEHLSTADRNLVTEIVYGTITWSGYLDFVIRNYLKGSIKKLEKWVQLLLRLSLYQIIFLERVPAYAVVNEAVAIAKKRGHKGISGVVNGILRSYLRNPDKAAIPDNLAPAEKIAIQHSHPQWLVERWIAAYGIEQTEQICVANNQAVKSTIRVNPLKCSRDQLIKKLEQENILAEPSPVYPFSVQLRSRGNPVDTQCYKEGLYTIQDESSMLVAHLLDPKPGMNVLDACAAPGGKSTHIAELMNNEGKIMANDLHAHKEKFIRQQAERLGLSIIQTTTGDAAHIDAMNYGTFDRILLDAPCTGFGVIRKKPDLKWNKQPADIKTITYVQYELLCSLSKLLNPEGTMIYSTCTIELEENQKLIERFLKEHPQFVLDERMVDDLPNDELKSNVEIPGMLQILPHYWGTDGFFIARLKHA